MKKITKLLFFLLVSVPVLIFTSCGNGNSVDPDDSDLMQGTTWISEYNIPVVGIEARGVYLFSTKTTGSWKATVSGVTVPFSTEPFTYSYKNKTITLNFEDGDKEVGSVNGKSMILTKDDGTVINYVKQ